MAVGKTLGQLVMINNKNLSPTVADELLEDAPLIAAISAIPSSNGTDHHYLRYISPPPAGFRLLNTGFAQGESTDFTVDIVCKILDASYHLDVRAVESYTQGDLIARENARHLRTAMSALEQQFINGDANGTGSPTLGGDILGFAGLVDTGQLDTLADKMVVPALGSAAQAVTSVYLIRSNPDDVSLVMGADGNITVGAPFKQFVAEGAGRFEAWGIGISSYYALQFGSTFSAGRICNIDPTGGTGNPLTDDLIATAISRFPAARKPNLIVMNRDSERMLRENRTATNQTGAPAPFAESAFGIPVIVTDQVANDESVVA